MTPEQNTNRIITKEITIQKFLLPDQNFANQEPFISLPKDVPEFGTYVKPDIKPEGIATCIYHIMRIYKDHDIFNNNTAQTAMKPYVHRWGSLIDAVAMTVKKHLLSFPTMDGYLLDYFSRSAQFFHADGTRKTNPKSLIFTFAMHQNIRHDARLAGLQNELGNQGLIPGDDSRVLKGAPGKIDAPQYWSIIRSEALK